MKDVIENAIKNLLGKAEQAEKASDAQTFAQAALNLAHVLATIEGCKK